MLIASVFDFSVLLVLLSLLPARAPVRQNLPSPVDQGGVPGLQALEPDLLHLHPYSLPLLVGDRIAWAGARRVRRLLLWHTPS